jgi:hypothetical protein
LWERGVILGIRHSAAPGPCMSWHRWMMMLL